MSKRILISAVLVGALVRSSAGCDLCAIYSASQARGEATEGFFAGVAEQFTHFGTVRVDGEKVPNPSGQYLDSSISQVFAGYNFTDRFGIQFNLPVIYRDFKRPDGLGGIDRGTESGIGDVSLLATAIPFQKITEDWSLSWSVLGGVKFPTGDSDRIGEELNEIEDPIGPPSGIHGHDLALGSGSYDGLVGTGFVARWQRLFLSASAQYSIRTTGDFDYRYANETTWSGGPGFYALLDSKYSLAVQAVVSGEYKGKDKFHGQPAEDTAITAVYLGPQITFDWGKHLAAYVVVDLPASIDNSSLQTTADYRIRGGFTWHF